MVMRSEKILKRLEAIEAELGDSSLDHYPAPNTITQGQLRWLCQGTRELLARLHKLERVAEAARKVWTAASDEVKEDMWFEMPPDWEGWEELWRRGDWERCPEDLRPQGGGCDPRLVQLADLCPV